VSAPLSIAVLGIGGIGSTFAYHLARAGHDVTAVARPGSLRLQQLQRDGGIVRHTGERAEVRVTGELDEEAAYDLVVVTLLAPQVDTVLPALARSKARAVQLMGNMLDPERPRDAVGAERCSFGMPFVMATVDGDGKLHATLNPGQRSLHGDRRWVELFEKAGLPSAFEADMPLWLRCHAPVGASFESIAVAGMRRGGGASWAEAMTVARGMRAGFAVVKALGHRLYPASKARMAACPTFVLAGMLWSVSRVTSFRELLATGVKECRALVDALAAAAETATPALPTQAAALRAMKPDDPA
jgi:2-dehydropantoate 2-reductase